MPAVSTTHSPVGGMTLMDCASARPAKSKRKTMRVKRGIRLTSRSRPLAPAVLLRRLQTEYGVRSPSSPREYWWGSFAQPSYTIARCGYNRGEPWRYDFRCPRAEPADPETRRLREAPGSSRRPPAGETARRCAATAPPEAAALPPDPRGRLR